MCRPPDVAPHLPANGRSQSVLNGNQVYQPRSWTAQQEQWSSVDHASWDLYDVGTTPQGQQFNYDNPGRAASVATLGLPLNQSIDEKFSNYGFVEPSAPQVFGHVPSANWNNVKFPLRDGNFWQDNSSAMSKWANALNPPKPDVGKLPNLSQWGAPSIGQMENSEGNLLDESPAVRNKKIKRMLSNRASAKRSRQRRQERLDELEIQSAKLHVEHASMTRKLKDALEASRRYQDENSRLKREIELLKSHLELSKSKRLKVSSDSSSEHLTESPESKSADSGKSATSSHSGDLSSDVEGARQQSRGISLEAFSPFSPDSGVTVTPIVAADAPLAELAFPMVNSDTIGHELDSLEDDWFAEIVDCFDQKPFAI